MAQVSKGFRALSPGELARGYSDVSVGQGPMAQRRIPGSDADSPMDVSASVHHGAGVPKPHTEGGLAHAFNSLKPAPDISTDPAPRQQGATRERTAGNADTDGGAAGSGAVPRK